jgi:hypothetical protein
MPVELESVLPIPEDVPVDKVPIVDRSILDPGL